MVGVNSTGFAPYVETGRLRLLATFNAQRSKRWPQVPTLRELGHPQAVYTSPYGIGVPSAVEPGIVRKLHDAFHAALFDPLHLQELAKYDQQPEYLNTADYGRFVQEVTARERLLLARLGITADDLQQIKENDPDAYTAELQKAHGTSWTVAARAKAESYGDQTRVRYNVQRAQKIDYAAAGQALLADIRSYGIV